jgi:hypothetical protein
MGALDFWQEGGRPPYHLSTHDVGVHRIGEDPATSVTDRYGEVHECAGLYAIGGGGFPSYGGYNPNLTIQALAYFSADALRRTRVWERVERLDGPQRACELHDPRDVLARDRRLTSRWRATRPARSIGARAVGKVIHLPRRGLVEGTRVVFGSSRACNSWAARERRCRAESPPAQPDLPGCIRR